MLLPADGVGELQLLWPALARLSQRKEAVIALVCPPYRPYPPAWHAAGIRLSALQVIRADTPRDALWATEQCLRSGACSAVLGWPRHADDRALRRLQVAAETGQAAGFVFRAAKAATNPSPAPLRLLLEAPGRLRVLKCRGGLPPAQAIVIPALQSLAGSSRQAVPAPSTPSAPVRPSLHEVLQGGLRPIAVPGTMSPEITAAASHPHPLAVRRPAAFPRALSSPAADSHGAALSPASPGTASPVPNGIAALPAQA